MNELLAIKIPDAALTLGVSERTIYQLIADGKLSAIKVAGATRITRDALLEFIANAPSARTRGRAA